MTKYSTSGRIYKLIFINDQSFKTCLIVVLQYSKNENAHVIKNDP